MSTHIMFFMENWRKLSQNYHQVLLNKSSVVFLDFALLEESRKKINKQSLKFIFFANPLGDFKSRVL